MKKVIAIAIVAIASLVGTIGLDAQHAAQTQKIDAEYTAKIKEALQDPRITTELVDHLPASDTVPTPLKFLGRYVGQPGELTYARDIHRYYEELAKVSPRARYWKIGTSEEGRDMVALAIADEATIKNLEKYRDQLAALTDPRKTTEAQAQVLLKSAKPIYYLTSGMHSPENGGPEMLIELAYRLIVEETPFIQNIRNNVITLITPVVEVDGREKQVDTYYYNKTRAQGDARLPLMYWGKYVQHDNNRDGMGQYLELTKAVTRTQLQWYPTIMHDLHEAQTYLYSSTGTGPYNDALDPIVISEWWQLAQNDVLEMTKRGVPGVWTYGFYDGWVPNYMFFIAHSHNAIGRFYEVQSYGPDNYEVRPGATTTSKEWFRPNPPLPFIKWGPRNNTNIQQSAVLFSLSHVAKNKELYLDNYWTKNKRAIAEGVDGPTNAWVIPAAQRRKADAADAVNELMRQGLEIHRATSAFKAGNVDVAAGDYVVRGDQPYRTLAEMYFTVQNYPPQNPSPYDDTGWTFQFMRNIKLTAVNDKNVFTQPMTKVTGPVKAAGGIDGAGATLVVEHTADNNLMTFRFKNADVKMLAAEEDFELNGRKIRAGAVIVPNADRARLEPMLRDLGLSAWGVAAAPAVKTHDLDIPRIGYVHSWTRTQDEGWVRAALDTYGVPYTYFADQKLKDETNLRSKYDVIIFPHVGGTRAVAGQRHGDDGPGAVAIQEDRQDAEPGFRRSGRRHPWRHGPRGPDEPGQVRPGGRDADHRRINGDHLPGVRGDQRRDRRDAGATVRSRLDSPRQVERRQEPAGLRLRECRPAGLLQPVSGAERGRRRHPRGVRRLLRWRRRGQRRPRPERHTERGARAHLSVRRRRCGRHQPADAGRSSGAVPADGPPVRHQCRGVTPARRDVVPAEPQRHAALGHARQRPVPVEPRGVGGRGARQRPRRDVCDSPLLALADAGHLLARFQRDHELERPGRGKGRTTIRDHQPAVSKSAIGS